MESSTVATKITKAAIGSGYGLINFIAYALRRCCMLRVLSVKDLSRQKKTDDTKPINSGFLCGF
jgi:hypothetical protein